MGRLGAGVPAWWSRGLGSMVLAWREVACHPRIKVVRACWASAVQAKAMRQRCVTGLGCSRALCAPVCIHAPLGLGAAMCGVDQHPALGHPSRGGGQQVIAIALRQGLHRLRDGVGQRVWHVGQGGRDTGDPLTPRCGQLLEVVFTRARAVSHKVGRPRGRVAWLHGLGDDLANGLWVTAMATEGLHEQRHASLVLHHEVTPHLVEVWAMIAAVAPGQVNHRRVRLLSTVVAAIDRETGALEMGTHRGKPEAWRRRGRQKTVECRDAIVIEHLQGAAQRVILEMLGRDPRGDEARRRFMLQKPRDEVPWLMHTAQPIQDHRFDRVAHSHHAGCWIVLQGPVPSVAKASFVKHPGHETEMVQDLTPGSSMPSGLLS